MTKLSVTSISQRWKCEWCGVWYDMVVLPQSLGCFVCCVFRVPPSSSIWICSRDGKRTDEMAETGRSSRIVSCYVVLCHNMSHVRDYFW